MWESFRSVVGIVIKGLRWLWNMIGIFLVVVGLVGVPGAYYLLPDETSKFIARTSDFFSADELDEVDEVDEASDKIPLILLTAENVCEAFRNETKWPLSKPKTVKPVHEDERIATYQRAHITDHREPEFQKIIKAGKEIHLIDSCIDYMDLNDMGLANVDGEEMTVKITKMENSAFLADVPKKTQFGNLTKVIFEGRSNLDGNSQDAILQKLNEVTFMGEMNEVTLRYVEAKKANFNGEETDRKQIAKLNIESSNIENATLNMIDFDDSKIQNTNARGAAFYESHTHPTKLEIDCTTIARDGDEEDLPEGQQLIEVNYSHPLRTRLPNIRTLKACGLE